MTAFRLKSMESREPEPGDILRNVDTGNQWLIHAARAVKTRTVDVIYPWVFQLEVERVARERMLDGDHVLIVFERLPATR